MKTSKRLRELIICAIEQGFGEDLRPLYKRPQLSLGTYFKLTCILEDDKSK